jgi:O-acetyl-ADP-ribose deacetylase (regulator of RNase III)
MKEFIIPKIEVRKASISTAQVHAIVIPTNSFGLMGDGVAEAIKKIGGQSIEDEAIENAPIQVGCAAITGAGDLVCNKVIHAPIMHNPAERTDSHKLMCAISAALELADDEGMRSIAIPGITTEDYGLKKDEAAKTIIKAIKRTKFRSIEKIILVDTDDEMVLAFQKNLKRG